MIVGTVNDKLEPRIPLLVESSGGNQRQVDALVDTGFTGMLSLPQETVDQLQLMPDANGAALLADEQWHECSAFWGFVVWHGQSLFKRIHSLGAEVFVGTEFLSGTAMAAEFRPGGKVTLEKLVVQQ